MIIWNENVCGAQSGLFSFKLCFVLFWFRLCLNFEIQMQTAQCVDTECRLVTDWSPVLTKLLAVWVVACVRSPLRVSQTKLTRHRLAAAFSANGGPRLNSSSRGCSTQHGQPGLTWAKGGAGHGPSTFWISNPLPTIAHTHTHTRTHYTSSLFGIWMLTQNAPPFQGATRFLAFLYHNKRVHVSPEYL